MMLFVTNLGLSLNLRMVKAAEPHAAFEFAALRILPLLAIRTNECRFSV